MECKHRENFPDDESAIEAGHNLCRACRKEAASSLPTQDLLILLKRMKTSRMNAIEYFRGILPRLRQPKF